VPRPPSRLPSPTLASLAALLVLALLSLAAPSAARAAAFDPAQMPTVRLGSRGAAVLVLQQALTDWRLRRGAAPLAVDGAFGPATRRAVLDFQWAFALYPDGVAGPITWRTLAAATPSPGGPAPGSLPGWRQGPESARQAGAWAAARLSGRFAVVDLRANGGRPVAVYAPRDLDPSRPATLLTYFHGHGGSVGLGFAASGLFRRIEDLAIRHPQTLFVFPQAASAPFRYWMAAPEDFASLEAEATLLARDLLSGRAPAPFARRVVSAHSGGGLALRNSVAARTFRADRIELLDASYGDWAQVVAAWAAARPAPRPTIEAWDTPGSTRTNDADIARRYPALVTVHASPVGHGAIPARFLGSALER
jgi:hypothetical protein